MERRIGTQIHSEEQLRVRTKKSVICQVTDICPHKCDFCYFYGNNPRFKGARPFGPIAKPEEWKEFIDKIIDPAETDNIIFSGGEPLVLGPQLLDMISHTKESKPGIAIGVKTNGVYLGKGHPKVPGDYATALKEAGANGVSISIESIDPKKHNLSQGVRDAHRYTVRGIENSLKAGLLTFTNTVVMPENVASIEATVHWLKGMGVHQIWVSQLRPYGRGKDLFERGEAEVDADKLGNLLDNIRGIPGVRLNGGNSDYPNVKTYGPDLVLQKDDVTGELG